VGHGLLLLPNLEAQRFVGRHSHPLAGTGTPSGRAQTPAQRGHHRQPECQEHRDERGYDAGKKVNGRKRHILVDTIGLLLMVMVLPADIQDRDGAKQLLAAFFSRKTRRRVQHIWADGGYTGTLLEWTRRLWRCTIEIVKRSDLHTFKVLPRRWVVERTFGWLGRYRRLNRDYERQAETGETMVYLAMIRLMLKRLG
jgi:putative transposase